MLTNRDELQAWTLLLRTPGLRYEHVAAALRCVSSASELIRCSFVDLARWGFPEAALNALRTPDWTLTEADIEWLEGPGHHLVTLNSPLYPPLLANAGGAPMALYVSGAPEVLATAQLAMVGSRNATAGGRDTARQFAEHFARSGLTITSGLAEGIDGASHEGALAGGGHTIAVCGTGLGSVYPSRHRALAERIAATGALVSEFPPDMGARRENFPRRNRIISGLSLGTLVVEAAKQSGSLITARLAAEQGREVFAIPGSIHNPMTRGCHQLIRDGAKLVETPEDVFSELRLPLPGMGAASPAQSPTTANAGTDKTDSEYEILLDALAFDPADLGTLARRSGLKPEAVSSMLLILELRGEVELRPGGRYCRKAQKQ